MIYMSDHGESLGEDGLYLHAAPYFIAPSQQTHIPFITWFAPEYASDTGLNLDCLRKTAAEPSSHDNLFHTVLGMMAVKTSAYDQSLIVLRPVGCRIMWYQIKMPRSLSGAFCFVTSSSHAKLLRSFGSNALNVAVDHVFQIFLTSGFWLRIDVFRFDF